MQLIREADKTEFVKQLRWVFLLKIHNIKTLIRFVITKEIPKIINVLPSETRGKYLWLLRWSHALSYRIHFPGERDERFDQKQLPPTTCTQATGRRATAVCSGTVCQTALLASAPRCPSEYAGGTANSTLPNGRAKAPCLHEGYLTLPCGRIDLEHLNGPEVTDCGFEQHSTWLFVYESSTRSFPNLPTVPVAHHKRIFQRFCSALLHSRSRMQYLHVANISVGQYFPIPAIFFYFFQV